MKAIGFTHYLPVSDVNSLQDIEIPTPTPHAHDLLVKLEAISVNPVDVKTRAPREVVETEPKILGWDAAGTVVAVGADVSLFNVGDRVYYAGSYIRQGANSEFHLVDERIVGRMPRTLDFAQAAALPLTAITAWEALFSRLKIAKDGSDAGKSLLIIGGSGGVGSIAIQLAKQLAKLKVIATASRAESQTWCRDLGADIVIDHFADMKAQLARADLTQVDYILCLNDTDMHFPAMVEVIAPQGMICSIAKNNQPLAVEALFAKSVGLVWEMMFTRSMFETPDMSEQHHLLNELSVLIDRGIIKTTLGHVLGSIHAENLRRAHALIEGGHTIGKIVLAGF